jgi:hypothetical protein
MFRNLATLLPPTMQPPSTEASSAPTVFSIHPLQLSRWLEEA